MYGRTDGWMGGWMYRDRQTDGWIDNTAYIYWVDKIV